MKLNTKGFSVLKGLIVLLVVAIVGFAGWKVWSGRRSSRQVSLSDQSQQAPSGANQNSQTSSTQGEYFEVKELGVKFKLTDKLTDLYYVIGNQGKTAYFSSIELKDTGCAADKTSAGALTRYTDADFARDNTARKEEAKKIGDYYFLMLLPQSECSESIDIQTKAGDLSAELSQTLPDSVELIQ